jgi:hypothetical protein
MTLMKKRRFLTAEESNQLSRQVTQARLKATGVLKAAQQQTSDPVLNKLFKAVKKASSDAESSNSFADEATVKKLAGC